MTERPISAHELEARIDAMLPGLIVIRNELNALIVDMQAFKATRRDHSALSTIRATYKALEAHFGVYPAQLRSKSKKAKNYSSGSRGGDVMKARHIFGALIKERTKLSYAEIGTYIDRDHATVINSCKAIKNAKDTNDILWEHYVLIQAMVNEILEGIP